MADRNRIQISVRLDARDKEFFAKATNDVGLEVSVAARQLIELVVQRLRSGGDYLDALYEIKTALSASKSVGTAELVRRRDR